MDRQLEKLQWMDYLNCNWLKDSILEDFFTREGVKKLFDLLVDQKEVTFVANTALTDNEPRLFDFEKDNPTLDEQVHYNGSLRANQVN